MSERITFKVELEFEGSADELRKITETLNELPVHIRPALDPEPQPWIPRPFPMPMPGPIPFPPKFPGGWPLPPIDFATPERLSKLGKAFPRIKEIVIGDIAGGIRNPHIHVKDEVIMLDRENFAEIVGMASEQIARDLALKGDYASAIGSINRLY